VRQFNVGHSTVPIEHKRTKRLLTVEYNHSLSCLYLDSYIFWSMTIINTKSQSKVKYSGCIFALQCTMSTQYSLKYTLYEIVKISKKISYRLAGGCKFSKMYMDKN
jgi:hypothetical protein